MQLTQEFQERVGRIDKLVQKLESSSDPSLRRTARELVQSLMELHGAGLERILEMISSAGESGAVLVQSLGHDELVSSLLVLYGLHPEDFETRVRRGLDNVRPILRSHGAHLEGIVIGEDTVSLQIKGPEADELRNAVREALLLTAPDAVDVHVEGGGERARSPSFVPLSSLLGCNGSPAITADVTRS